ncbi:protein LEG1 homolog [Osmerus mordax]|uniref:protein LEG1 homolog n=1 Tax=Osmerus mordax TaxID=8014 RepID=UPI00350FD545
MHVLGMLSGLLVLLAACSGPAHSAIITENNLPILWAEASSQLSDLPQQDNIVTINPWNYQQRMTLYRLQLAASDQYMGSMGPNTTEGNPLWSLPLQLGWKLRSGRLLDPTSATTCGQESDSMCISGQSWWACVNYYLSVIPFLAAVQKGVIGDGQLQVQIQTPSDAVQDYCTSYTDCSTKFPDLMAKWEAFYQGMKDLSVAAIMDVEKKDQILGLMWAAQQFSLQTASSTCQEKLKHYSYPEKAFAESWLSSADFVAATHFQSTVERSVLFMTPLPGRVLREGDQAPNIQDLSPEENHTLSIFNWMRNMNSVLGGTLVRMWRSAMCSQKAREQGQTLLQDLTLNPKFALTTVFSILSEMSTNC